MSQYTIRFEEITADCDHRYAKTPYHFHLAWVTGGKEQVERSFNPVNRVKWHEMLAWCEQRCGPRGLYLLNNRLVDGTWACTPTCFMLSDRNAAMDFRLTW